MLFETATHSLKVFGDKYLGGELGITAILHTWGQDLRPHVHLHCIVTGGALSRDQQRWLNSREGFLFPIAITKMGARSRC